MAVVEYPTDAALITATPALLAALERLWEWQRTCQELPSDGLADHVTSAIAQARGGSDPGV